MVRVAVRSGVIVTPSVTVCEDVKEWESVGVPVSLSDTEADAVDSEIEMVDDWDDECVPVGSRVSVPVELAECERVRGDVAVIEALMVLGAVEVDVGDGVGVNVSVTVGWKT